MPLFREEDLPTAGKKSATTATRPATAVSMISATRYPWTTPAAPDRWPVAALAAATSAATPMAPPIWRARRAGSGHGGQG
jgi:hypothetical protein